MDEDWAGCSDLATDRAGALCDLACNFDAVKNAKVKRAMLRAMDLLNDGIESAVRPTGKRANVVPLRQVPPDAS